MRVATEEAREKFNSLGLTYKDVTKHKFDSLVVIVVEELKSFTPLPMEVENVVKKNLIFSKEGGIVTGFIKVKSFYFKKREAISFNRNGFIGFAGWSDSKNLQPFLNAFYKWLKTEFAEQSISSIEQETK